MSNNAGFILVVSGPSGSGKSTIVKSFLARNDGFDVSISHTTRASRPGDIDGRDYYFVDEAAFEGMVKRNEFVEWATVYGNNYGTSRAELQRILDAGKNVLLEIDVKGAASVRASFGESVVSVFILPDTFAELERRLKARSTDAEDVILKRINEARREIAELDRYDYVIINHAHRITESTDMLSTICITERARSARFWSGYESIFWR